MDTLIINIFSYSGLLLGSVIGIYGFYSLVKKETFFIGKDSQSVKLKGVEALRYSLFYIFAGLIWVWYSASQIFDFL